MTLTFQHFADKLSEFVDASNDGYGIFSAEDTLVCCNPACCAFFGVPESWIIGKTFSEIMREVFRLGSGPKIDDDDIDHWLSNVMPRRRSRDFRLFEVDLTDGRWFLVSEQKLPSTELLMQVKEITKQKQLEYDLNNNAERLNSLALTDDLTQIANRRSFIASVKAKSAQARRAQANVAFLLLDIDHFKQINDVYGHQTGDEVLCSFVNRVKIALREYDTFGRVGGEEFGVFLTEISHDMALEVAERIRAEVQHNLFCNSVWLTVSVGLALVSADAEFEQMYNLADKALYQAKKLGRNQTVVLSIPENTT